jgi:hypothetical protein
MKARGDGWPTTRVSGDDAVAIYPAVAVEEGEQRTRSLALFRGLSRAIVQRFAMIETSSLDEAALATCKYRFGRREFSAL